MTTFMDWSRKNNRNDITGVVPEGAAPVFSITGMFIFYGESPIQNNLSRGILTEKRFLKLTDAMEKERKITGTVCRK